MSGEEVVRRYEVENELLQTDVPLRAQHVPTLMGVTAAMAKLKKGKGLGSSTTLGTVGSTPRQLSLSV